MFEISELQYKYALARIEELLPSTDESTPVNDKNSIELSIMSEIVMAYENKHFPIEKPTIAELIDLALEEASMTQKELAERTGIRPPTISAICTGSVKHLPVDALDKICKVLECQPADIMEYIEETQES